MLEFFEIVIPANTWKEQGRKSRPFAVEARWIEKG